MNETLRSYVTSVGFSLTLTKLQIDMLVLLHHYGGFKGAHDHAEQDSKGEPASRSTSRRPTTRTLSSHWVSTSAGLHGRGLLGDGWKLTKAGDLTVEILKEAGIYQDSLARMEVKGKPRRRKAAAA